MFVSFYFSRNHKHPPLKSICNYFKKPNVDRIAFSAAQISIAATRFSLFPILLSKIPFLIAQNLNSLNILNSITLNGNIFDTQFYYKPLPADSSRKCCIFSHCKWSQHKNHCCSFYADLALYLPFCAYDESPHFPSFHLKTAPDLPIHIVKIPLLPSNLPLL